MINKAAMELASLSTIELHAMYNVSTPAVQSKYKLPRDYLINTLLSRQFGQQAIDNHTSIPIITNNPSWSTRR